MQFIFKISPITGIFLKKANTTGIKLPNKFINPKNSINKPIKVHFNKIKRIPKTKKNVPIALLFWKIKWIDCFTPITKIIPTTNNKFPIDKNPRSKAKIKPKNEQNNPIPVITAPISI